MGDQTIVRALEQHDTGVNLKDVDQFKFVFDVVVFLQRLDCYQCSVDELLGRIRRQCTGYGLFNRGHERFSLGKQMDRIRPWAATL